METKILVVEDEQDICEILQFNLQTHNYQVETVNSAEEALKMEIADFSLIILDVMMAEMSGFEFAKLITKQYQDACPPIIFLSAMDQELHKLKGFDAGADDYITKPFSVNEVIARVKSVLKRTRKELPKEEAVEETLRYEGLEVNLESKQVSVDGERVKLTPKELEILCLLLRKPGKVYSRERILSKVWQENVYVMDRAIDVNIARLRKKIKHYGKKIISRTGYGYSFQP